MAPKQTRNFHIDEHLYGKAKLDTSMSGSVAFCPHCGSLLELADRDPIRCPFCSYSTDYNSMRNIEIVTRSVPRPAPLWLSDRSEERDDGHATVEEPCPKCNHPQMKFYTMQLRSADEGSTVFYECLNKKCQHKFNLNN